MEAPDSSQAQAEEGEAVAEEAPENKGMSLTPAQIDNIKRQVQAQLLRQAIRSRHAGYEPKEKPVQSITFEELVQALKSVRIWVRQGAGTIHEPGTSDIAYRMKALNPEDAAKDIFTSVRVAKGE